MRFILDSAAKDLRRRLADPVAVLIWVGIPLLLAGLLSMISSGPGGGTPIARVLIVDQDDSLVSSLLVGAAGQDAMGGFIDAETVDLQQGQQLMDDGEASALLIIPEGFGRAVLLEEPTTLTLITNPAQRILPGIIEEGLSILVEVAFYGQRFVGPQLRAIVEMGDEDEGPSIAEVTAISEQFYERIQSAQVMLFPPALVLGKEVAEADTAEQEDSSQGFNVVRVFLPAMLFMSILFVAQGMSDDIWHESQQGTLRRLIATPRRVEQMLAGKLLAGVTIMGIVAMVAMPMAWWLAGFDLVRLPIALLWCIYAGGALLTYFMLIQSLATSQRGGTLLSTLVLFPLMMIGGSFFPFAVMPNWMANLGRLTPNGLALTHLERILWGDPSPGGLLTAAAAIGVPAVVAFLICSMRMRSETLVG